MTISFYTLISMEVKPHYIVFIMYYHVHDKKINYSV